MGNVLVENSNASSGDSSNILKIENLFFINNSNASSIGERIINYYNKKYKSKFKFILDDEKVGDRVLIEENFDNKLDGIITLLDIDLTGGYVTNCEVVAKVGDSNG